MKLELMLSEFSIILSQSIEESTSLLTLTSESSYVGSSSLAEESVFVVVILATHSGILSSMQSTAPYGTASSRMQCSSTNLSVSHRPVFLLNSCLSLFSAACSRRHPFSLSYGAILPSSLAILLPPALGFSPHPPVSVYGTGTI